MQQIRTVQTAFRFKPDMLSRMKNRARLQGKSLNNYVESLIEKDLALAEDRYQELFKDLSQLKRSGKVSTELEEFFGTCIEFTESEIAADERLAYILGK